MRMMFRPPSVFALVTGSIERSFAFASVLLLIAVASVMTLAPAHAQEATAATSSVTFAYGDIVTKICEVILSCAAGFVAWLMTKIKLPAAVTQFLNTMQAEQLLTKAIDFGIQSVEGAVKGKQLTVDVGSPVLAAAVQYVLDHGPGWLIDWLGGEDQIRQKILARLDLEPAASVTTATPTAAAAPVAATNVTTLNPPTTQSTATAQPG